jgi:hypothetical protein
MVGLIGGRLIAWAVLGGGGLLVALMLWQGAKRSGARVENSKWQSAIQEQVRDNRGANYNVDSSTIVEQGSLQEQEAAIRQKWLTMGRQPKQEKN